jgi:hypothetical protein
VYRLSLPKVSEPRLGFLSIGFSYATSSLNYQNAVRQPPILIPNRMLMATWVGISFPEA